MNLDDPAWAWAPFRPDSVNPWGLRQAGHMFRRAAFGATWDDLQQALKEGPQATIDRLLQPPGDGTEFDRVQDRYAKSASDSLTASAWWLRRLIESPHPLREQMTLFWHNHFALSALPAGDPRLITRYLQVLRRHALGNYEALLVELMGEPALFAALGARTSRKSRPNDYFARVWLEQYTVGPGQYSAAEVREVARAVTGWFVSQQQLQEIPLEHDDSRKRVLGQEGNFAAGDVARILARQPAAAAQVVRKLYRWFVSETIAPSENLIAPLAADFGRDLDVARLVGTMLRSNLFFSTAAYRQKVKSPVEFALGILRPMGGTVSTLRLAADLAALGQDLYEPPTVKGWPTGRAWLNRITVLGRTRLAHSLLVGGGDYETKLDSHALALRQGRQSPEAGCRFLLQLFLQDDLPDNTRQKLLEIAAAASGGNEGRLREAAALTASLPEFQLT